MQQKKRHPSGGQGSIGILPLMGVGHLSPDLTKGSNSSMEQTGSYETHYMSPASSKDPNEVIDDDNDNAEGLKLTSTLVEIADVMKTGLNFVNKVVQV